MEEVLKVYLDHLLIRVGCQSYVQDLKVTWIVIIVSWIVIKVTWTEFSKLVELAYLAIVLDKGRSPDAYYV